MRHLLFSLTLLLAISSAAKEAYFSPSWKTGDSYECKIVTKETQLKNGALESDTVTANSSQMTVLETSTEAYLLELKMENQGFRQAMEMYKKLGKDYSNFQDLTLRFKVNKKDGDFIITNRTEAVKFLKEGFESISGALGDDDSLGIGLILQVAMSPILNALDNDTTATDYWAEHLQVYITPFWKKLIPNDTLSITTEAKNPFKKGTKLSGTENFILTEYTDETASITQEKVMDMKLFMDAMKDMSLKMMKAFGAPQKKIDETVAMFDQMKFDYTDKSQIQFDVKKNMVTSIQQEVAVFMDSGTEKEGSSKKTVIKNYNFTKIK